MLSFLVSSYNKYKEGAISHFQINNRKNQMLGEVLVDVLQEMNSHDRDRVAYVLGHSLDAEICNHHYYVRIGDNPDPKRLEALEQLKSLLEESNERS